MVLIKNYSMKTYGEMEAFLILKSIQTGVSIQLHIPSHFTLRQERMVPSGQKTKRASERREFLCSSENWSQVLQTDPWALH
jgi:hypothetical protein